MNPGLPTRWTAEAIAQAIETLGRHTDLESALEELSEQLGFEVTKPAIYSALTKSGHRSAFHYLKKVPYKAKRQPELRAVPEPLDVPDFSEPIAEEDQTNPHIELPAEFIDPVSAGSYKVYLTGHGGGAGGGAAKVEEPKVPAKFDRLIEVAKKHAKRGGLSLEALCNDLDLTPKEARALIDNAQKHGVIIEVAHDHLYIKPPEPSPNAPAVEIAPSGEGSLHRIGIFSDLHFGSKYCLRAQLARFMRDCYDNGIRDFFCPGDLLEGCYRHAQWELSGTSWEDQAMEMLETLPILEGARIFFIDGNHDYTWTDRTGVESGRNLVRLAEQMGRTDLHFFGSRGALINYGGTKIELWHPKKSNGYALSYQLQNKIRDTAPERLPHILLCGHTHQYVKFRRSNVWAFYCGTFQHGDAPYGRSLGGDVTMGGIVLEWVLETDGTVRKLSDTLVLARHTPKTFDVAV